MAEWITCRTCGLRHSARADGFCPRCKSALGPPAIGALPGSGMDPVVPAASLARETAVPPPAPFPIGARVAGWVLYANALTAILAMIKLGVRPTDPASGLAGIPSLLVDVAVGTYLVAGREKARPWALGRVVLGGLVFTPILWSNAGPALGLMQLAFSLALILLLVGRPGPLRMGAGLLPAAGILALYLGVLTDPAIAGAVRGAGADLLDRHVDAWEGQLGRWRITFTPSRWHSMKRVPPGMESAFSWPERGASLGVAVKDLPPGADTDLQRISHAVMQGVQAADPRYAELERRQVRTPGGLALAVRAAVSGTPPEQGWFVVHSAHGRFALVVAGAPADSPPEVLEELLSAASALVLEPQR